MLTVTTRALNVYSDYIVCFVLIATRCLDGATGRLDGTAGRLDGATGCLDAAAGSLAVRALGQ